jgi:hypothetical protein
MQIMTVTAIAVIVAMALFYIVSTGNEGMMSIAKGGIKASLIGFAVMLAAWLLVNVVLTLLVNSTFIGGIKQGSTFTFSCDSGSSAGTTTTTQTPPTIPPSTSTAPFCGDSIQNGTEACDDGDSTHGDGNGANCSKDCSTFCTKNTCMANGACGSATTGSFTVAPTENLCSKGKASAVTLKSGAWAWTCSGVNGGSPQNCTATKNTDTGPDDPGSGSSSGSGVSCPATSPEGIPYNKNLPKAPLKNWTAEQLYSYWNNLPIQNCPDGPDPMDMWNEPVKLQMYTQFYGLTNGRAFVNLINQRRFRGSPLEYNNWLNGNDYACGNAAMFDVNTGIGRYTVPGESIQQFVYPAGGIPCR